MKRTTRPRTSGRSTPTTRGRRAVWRLTKMRLSAIGSICSAATTSGTTTRFRRSTATTRSPTPGNWTSPPCRRPTGESVPSFSGSQSTVLGDAATVLRPTTRPMRSARPPTRSPREAPCRRPARTRRGLSTAAGSGSAEDGARRTARFPSSRSTTRPATPTRPVPRFRRRARAWPGPAFWTTIESTRSSTRKRSRSSTGTSSPASGKSSPRQRQPKGQTGGSVSPRSATVCMFSAAEISPNRPRYRRSTSLRCGKVWWVIGPSTSRRSIKAG